MTVSTLESRPRLLFWFKKILIGGLASILFLLALLFATFAFIQNNPARLEVVFETVVTRLLGRELQIGEILESELGLESYLLARDVTLANPGWAEEVNFVQAGRILIRISLPSIWQDGPILIRELELADATVNLITAQDNPANWEFWPDAPQLELAAEEVTAAKAPSPVFPLRILSGNVTRGALTIHSASRDIAVVIDDLDLSEPSEGGLLNLDLNGAINSIPLKVKGGVGPTVALLIQRDLRMEVEVQLGELFFQSTGSIENLVTMSGPDLQVDISSPRSQPFLKLLGIAGSADGPFNFKGHVSDAHPGIAVQAAGVLNGIEVQLSGEVEDPLEVSGLQMELELHGPSISELGAMLGVSGLPVTPYDIKGTLESKPQGVQSLSFQFVGPWSRLELNGILGASPDYLGSHLNLELSGERQAAIGPWLGLDFLPPTEFQLSGALTRIDSGWQLSEAVFKSDELQLKVEASVDEFSTLMAQLELSSANISSLLASYGVEAEGVPALPIAVNAVISGSPDSLKIEQLTAKSGASRLKVSGLLGDLTKRENINLAVEVDTANLMEFLPDKGKENVPVLPLDLQGNVIVTADGLGVKDLSGTIGESKLALQGSLNLVAPVKDSKFSVQFGGPNLGAVLNPWLEREFSAVPFQVAMKADFSSGGLEVSQLEATVDDAQLSGKITIVDLKNPASAQGDFRLKGPSSWKLSGMLGSKPVFSDSSYSLEVGFSNSDEWLRVNPIVFQWGKSDLSGSVNYRPGSVVTIEADLYSKFVDVPSVIRSTEQLEKAKAEAAKGTDRSETSTSEVLTEEQLSDRVIPNVTLDFSPLKRFQGSFKYSADVVYLDDETRSSTSVELALNDGLLSSSKLTWDGTLISGDAALTVKALEEGGEIEVGLDASRIPVIALLGGEAKYDPNARYEVHIKSTGNSWRELAKSANGALVFQGGGGRMDNNGGGLILGDVFEQVLSRLNPFKETDRYTKIICHAAAFSIVEGKASLVPGAVVRTEKLDFAAGGAIDLHKEKLDVVFSSRSRKGIGISASKAITPYFKLGGTLAYPQIVLDPKGVALSGGVAVATAGMSILAEGLWDRWVATATNPCEKLIKQVSEQDKEMFKKLLSPASTDNSTH